MTIKAFNLSERFDTAKRRTDPAENPAPKRQKQHAPAPFSLRLSFGERQQLMKAAGSQPLGGYIRDQLLGPGVTQPRRKSRAPVQDQEALARVLAQLGASKLANNLNQLARAANSGSLPVTPDIEKSLREACADIRHMRLELLKALGIQPEPDR